MEKKERNWQEYLTVLYRRKWLFALVFMLILISTAVFTFTVTPLYQARTTLLIEEKGGVENQIFEISSLSLKETVLKNQVEILRSRSLAAAVLDALSGSPFSNYLNRIVSENLSVDLRKENAIKFLRKNLKVTPIRETDVIEIKVSAPDPDLAAFLANTYAREYYKQSLRQSRGEVSEVRQFLEQQLENVQKELKVSEEALKDYKEKEKVTALSDETAELVKQLAEFEGLFNGAQTDLNAAQKRLDYLKSQLDERKSKLVSDISSLSSPVVAQMREEIAKLEAMWVSYIAQGFAASHPKLQELTRRIEDTKGKLVEATEKLVASEILGENPLALSQDLVNKILVLETEIRTLSARTKSLESVVDSYSKQLNSLPEKGLKLARLERQARVGENIFLMLKEKYEEARIKEAGQIGKVTIIDPAVADPEPIKPQKKLNLFLGTLLGLALGMLAALIIDRSDNTVKTQEELENLGVAVIGTIPMLKTNGDLRHQSHKQKKRHQTEIQRISSHLISHIEPRSLFSEAYRTVRTNLQFAQPDAKLKTILITSPGPGEGKSTTAANLAITLAQNGMQTLLVDADLRKPVLHSVLSVSKEPGLSHFLSGRAQLESICKPTPVTNLFLAPCGVIPPNPSELLGSRKCKELIDELKARYDFVLFDSPPAIAVADAMILSSLLDGVVLVISAGETHLPSIHKVLCSMGNVKAKVIGGVFNKSHFRRSYWYYKYYHYYRAEEDRASQEILASPDNNGSKVVVGF